VSLPGSNMLRIIGSKKKDRIAKVVLEGNRHTCILVSFIRRLLSIMDYSYNEVRIHYIHFRGFFNEERPDKPVRYSTEIN